MEGGFIMKVNYKKLWHILLDRNMEKELAEDDIMEFEDKE